MSEQRDTIEVGDRVNVGFVGDVATIFNAKVVGIPYATGDSWRLVREDSLVEGEPMVIYVQQFETMMRTKKHADIF